MSRGRLEVWYATFTDRATGTGGWIHHETVTPTDGRGPRAHGWVAVFPPDASPIVERFGPVPAEPTAAGPWHRVDGCIVDDGVLRGAAGTVAWDLQFEAGGPPLHTFPRAAFERRLLPGAQIVPWPSASITGTVAVGGEVRQVDALGAVARIDGHGNAERWGWLHADLDGGGTLEVVTATPRLPGLRRLPPLALVQLRLPGEPDWPRLPLVAAPLLRTQLAADGFTVAGRTGSRRIDVAVTLPPGRTATLAYTDPDGAGATCTNSEVASASVRVRDRSGDERRWVLAGRAHAEVGHRRRSPAG